MASNLLAEVVSETRIISNEMAEKWQKWIMKEWLQHALINSNPKKTEPFSNERRIWDADG